MYVSSISSENQQVINSYGPGCFRIAKIVYKTSVLVFPERTISWPVKEMSEVSLLSFAELINSTPSVEVLLVGCGTRMERLETNLQRALRENGITADSMDTGAACRTFNLLLAEGRSLAASLIIL